MAKRTVVQDKKTNQDMAISNFELHRQMYAKMKEPDTKKVHDGFTSMAAWFSSHHPNDRYYILLCRDINYYTVFHFNSMNYDKGVQEIQKTLEFRGSILDVSYDDFNQIYECWVREKDGSINMYVMTDYDWGVVEID